MVRGGPANRAIKRAKIFALTKGFRGRAKNCYSIAVRAAQKALQHAYRGRRLKKRDMRELWIQRINYGAQEHGANYSQMISGLAKCHIQLNRKVLSEMAIHEPKTFQALVGISQRRHGLPLEEVLSDSSRLVLHRGSQETRVAEEEVETEKKELYKTAVVDSEKGKVLETLV